MAPEDRAPALPPPAPEGASFPALVPIGLFDTQTPLAPLQPLLHRRAAEVLARGVFILGPEVQAFEAEFAAYLGVEHVIGVANGTDAITIALRAMGVEPGDEVIVPALTFYASAEAVVNAGARPVFCDVDPETRNLSPETVERVRTERTRAIVAVDLFGVPAPVPALRELGLPVLEDAAQAAGSELDGIRAGALGDVATFSFYPSKNLACFGDGGAIATNDERIAGAARALRFHGSRDKETFDVVGYNSRLDELQAAFLRVLLPQLDAWSAGRGRVAEAYARTPLAELVGLPASPPGARVAWHLYPVTHPRAGELVEELTARGIGARGYYRRPLHRQRALQPFLSGRESLPVTEELARTNVALPMSPVLSERQVEEVAEAVVAGIAALR